MPGRGSLDTQQSVNQGGSNKYIVFGALAIGLFASVVDHGSVIVALPSIAEDMVIELPSVQWVVIGYALTISALLLPMGRLADMMGQKRVYILGSVILMVGAAGAGLAPELGSLLGARLLQGVGSAMTQGTGMAIMTSVFPAQERGRAIGLLMTTVGVGAVAGPAIGGTVVDFIHWRAVFFINIPLGIAGVLATLWVLRGWESERASRGSRFDWTGAFLSTGVLVALLLGLTLAVNWGWTAAPILAAFVLSASDVRDIHLVGAADRLPNVQPEILPGARLFLRGLGGVPHLPGTVVGAVPHALLRPERAGVQPEGGRAGGYAGGAVDGDHGLGQRHVVGQVRLALVHRGWNDILHRRSADTQPPDGRLSFVGGDTRADIGQRGNGDLLFGQLQLGAERGRDGRATAWFRAF